MTTRRAVVIRNQRSLKPTVEEVERYLPSNYRVLGATPGAITIEGSDNAGWTLDGYIIPRLGSGLIHAREVPEGQRWLHQIADEIVKDWKRPNFGAVPYIEAMRYLATTADAYLDDPGDEIVQRFLTNARTWKGETATRVKAELKAILDAK